MTPSQIRFFLPLICTVLCNCETGFEARRSSTFMKPIGPDRLASQGWTDRLHEANKSGPFGFIKPDQPASWGRTVRLRSRSHSYIWLCTQKFSWNNSWEESEIFVQKQQLSFLYEVKFSKLHFDYFYFVLIFTFCVRGDLIKISLCDLSWVT